MFRVGHIFEKTKLWEANIAQRLSKFTSPLENKYGTIGQALIVIIGFTYMVFAVFYRVAVTALLVTLLWLLRFVIPGFYLIVTFWFGITSTLSLFDDILSELGGESILSVPMNQMVQTLPSLVLLILFLTGYISVVYVVGRLYTQVVYDGVEYGKSNQGRT